MVLGMKLQDSVTMLILLPNEVEPAIGLLEACLMNFMSDILGLAFTALDFPDGPAFACCLTGLSICS